MTPEKVSNNDKRLDALMALNILDTPAEERFDRLTRMAKRIFSVPIALVSLVDKNRLWFKSTCDVDATEMPSHNTFCKDAVLSNEGVYVVNDASRDPRYSDNPLVLGEPHIRFYAGIPLKAANGERLGMLCIIDTIPRRLNANDIKTLKDLAHTAERELSMVQLATIDELTRIPNRRGLSVRAKNIIPYSMRHNIPVSLVYFDLNNFKHINDTYGHTQGDQVLKIFAESLQNCARQTDVIGRLGGDEFVAILSDTSEPIAEHMVNRLNGKLAERCTQEKLPQEITFSYGVVAYDRNRHDSLLSLMQEGDALMYKNKKRNKQELNLAHLNQ